MLTQAFNGQPEEVFLWDDGDGDQNAVILNAIKSNVVEAHSQFSDFVMTQYGDNTPSKIDLKLPSELAKFLDVS